jgi:hypothetical protein
VKNWGTSVELPAVTKEEAQEAYLEATSPTRALTPPVATAVAARDDMLKDRFNYVSKNLNPDAQYVVMGGKGKVAPAAVGQTSFLIAGVCVLLGAIGGVVYIKSQWGVSNPKELGDRLRERGAEKRAVLERSNTAHLVRTVSQNAEGVVKKNVELVRTPSQQLGQHFGETFKGAPGRRPNNQQLPCHRRPSPRLSPNCAPFVPGTASQGWSRKTAEMQPRADTPESVASAASSCVAVPGSFA